MAFKRPIEIKGTRTSLPDAYWTRGRSTFDWLHKHAELLMVGFADESMRRADADAGFDVRRLTIGPAEFDVFFATVQTPGALAAAEYRAWRESDAAKTEGAPPKRIKVPLAAGGTKDVDVPQPNVSFFADAIDV